MTVETNKFIRTDYVNHSCAIFEGFYESNLFNSDTMYYFNSDNVSSDREEGYLGKDEEYDVDFKAYSKEVCEIATDLLEEVATEYLSEDEQILKNFKLLNISSPHYYNFETDKLHIELDVNVHALENYCFTSNKDDFNNYLRDNFTSYDGFISFIDNNLTDFRFTYNTKGTDSVELNVMIEYYLLTRIYETTDLRTVKTRNQDDYHYHFRLIEEASSCLLNHLITVKVDN